jgi:hypothetical protein
MKNQKNKNSLRPLLYLLLLCRCFGSSKRSFTSKQPAAAKPSPNSHLPLRDPKDDPNHPDFCYYEIHKEITGIGGQIPIHYDLKIPQLKQESAAADAINSRLALTCQTLLSQMQKRMRRGEDDRTEPIATGHYLYQADYRITYYTENYCCILIEEYENKGGAHGMPYRESLIFDRCTGEEVRGNQLFAESSEKRKKLKEQAFRKLITASPKDYWDNALQTICEEGSGDTNYYLTDSGTTFYYPPYELAPYAAGYVEATVPYSQLPLKC